MSHPPSIWLHVALSGVAVTYVWRLMGALLVSRIDPAGPVLIWVRAVATALVAALVARMVFLPSGLLAGSHLAARLAALGIGVALWRLAGRKVGAGVAAAVVGFLLLEGLMRGL